MLLKLSNSPSTSSTNTPVATWPAPMFPERNVKKYERNSSNASLSGSIQKGTSSYTEVGYSCICHFTSYYNKKKGDQCSLPPEAAALRLTATMWLTTCAAKLTFIAHCAAGDRWASVSL
jgi:hypothetical protein